MLLVVAAETLRAAVTPELSGDLYTEFETAYLSSSGTLCDTRPVSLQNLDWTARFGEYGRVGGYGCFLSSLHDRQHELHRAAFNEFEGGVFYGYDWDLNARQTLVTDAGFIWNPLIGYRNDPDDLWEFRMVQALENPYVTPYWDLLALMEPDQWSRVRVGVRRKFDLSDSVTLTPWVDVVWGCARRYEARYGEEPEDPVGGGAVYCSIVGLKLEKRFAERWRIYAKVRQFDTLGSQAREAEKRKTEYYARSDIAIFTVGVAVDF